MRNTRRKLKSNMPVPPALDVPIHLNRWLALTEPDDQIKEQIIQDINTEIETGNIRTGLSPYIKNGETMFKQKWIKLIGKKAD